VTVQRQARQQQGRMAMVRQPRKVGGARYTGAEPGGCAVSRRRKKSSSALKETARQDIAQAEARAASARTPVAKAATRAIADRKRAKHSGEGVKATGASMARDALPAPGSTARKGARTGRGSGKR
jgi:hypothetical protein